MQAWEGLGRGALRPAVTKYGPASIAKYLTCSCMCARKGNSDHWNCRVHTVPLCQPFSTTLGKSANTCKRV